MRNGMVLGFMTLFVLGIVGGTAWGQALPLCDYTPPQNRLAALILSGDYRYFNDRLLSDQGNVNAGQLTLRGFSWSEGPQWSYSIDGSAGVEFSPQGVTWSALLASEGDLRRYLEGELFVFGGADTMGLPGSSDLTISGLAGAGWGRFRNVTPLAKALQAAKVLLDQGVLSEAPSEETLQNLAELIGRERELGLAEVLKGIEELLGETLDVAAVLALQEVLTADIARFCGWDVSLALGYEILDPTGRNDALLLARARYAAAVGPKAELLTAARWRAPLPLTGVYTFSASLDYHRQLTPKIDSDFAYRYLRSQDAAGFLNEIHALELTLGFQVQFNLSATMSGKISRGSGFEETEWGFELGFQYDIF